MKPLRTLLQTFKPLKPSDQPHTIIEENDADIDIPYDRIFRRVGCDGKTLAAFLAASQMRSYEESYEQVLRLAGINYRIYFLFKVPSAYGLYSRVKNMPTNE